MQGYEKIKVSIIVPVYNVEDFLDECLSSIVRQTLKDIEIICVDDGSTDNSRLIIDDFVKNDKRVRLIAKENSGYGATLNCGIKSALGEYVGIVESDDYIAPDTYETLYFACKKHNLDVVKSDYFTFSTTNKKNQTYRATCKNINDYNVVFNPKRDVKIFSFRMNTWTGLYRTDFLRDYGILHNETQGASYQDNGFWFQTLALCERIMFIHRAFYHYRQDNPNSSINSKSKVFCMNDEYAFIYDFLEKNKDLKKLFLNQYFEKKFFNYLYNYGRIADEYKLPFLERFSQELKEDISRGIDLVKLNNRWIADMALRIMDDYKAFYYEDTIYRLKSEREQVNNRLNSLRNSAELQTGRKITGYIKRILNNNYAR